MLWWLGAIAFGFTYVAAANVHETRTLGSGLLASSFDACRTFDPIKWFETGCSDLLYERLGVLAIGAAVLIICGYTVQAFEDGTALLSWEFAIGEYLATKGIQFGSDETLNQFAYPRVDSRGPQDGTWLASAIDQAKEILADVRFDRPGS